MKTMDQETARRIALKEAKSILSSYNENEYEYLSGVPLYENGAWLFFTNEKILMPEPLPDTSIKGSPLSPEGGVRHGHCGIFVSSRGEVMTAGSPEWSIERFKEHLSLISRYFNIREGN